MRFSLRNLLMAIIFMAAFLGLLLADHDAKLKRQAILFQQQRELIERSKSFHLPITQAELDQNIKEHQLFLKEFAQR